MAALFPQSFLFFPVPSLIETIKIPKERIAVLIGKNGAVKKELEKLTEMKIEIDSKTGEVFIEPAKSNANFLSAAGIVKAIARGFSPKNALLLLDEEFYLEIIDVGEFGKTKKRQFSRKGRVIGAEGKIRTRIETETDTKISVFGKTISIIGKVEDAARAKKAVEMLLMGARHAKIFEYLKESSAGEKFEL